MGIFSIEHSRAMYFSDTVLHSAVVLAGVPWVLITGPSDHRLRYGALFFMGVGLWTLLEYAIHRCVLHGLPPFKSWHALHHARPSAYIAPPTIVTAGLFWVIGYLPLTLLSDTWTASALVLGLVTGYVIYSLTHHAIHHWPISNAWLTQRKTLHFQHHHARGHGHFGVTMAWWDRCFKSDRRTTGTAKDANP
jgi:cyclopropane-fatty-acyl-phospholipid synthase